MGTASIDPRAVVDPTATLGEGVHVGPFCVVGAGASIGARTRLEAHVVVDGSVTLGPDNVVAPFASLGGPPQDLKYKGEPTKVVIGAGNQIKECVTINRGTVGGGGVTRIGDGCLIMAYVHIAHDCQIGSRIIFANGATLDLKSPRVVKIEVLPQDPVVQQIGSRQQMRVVATYGDGNVRDVTAEAFIESGNTDVWLMDPDGKNRKQLTTGSGFNTTPVPSADGLYIVFASLQNGVRNIWRMNSNGSNPVRLTNGLADGLPAISPDSKWVVYNALAQTKGTLWKVPIRSAPLCP
jgi:acetyltransferase-like isoleucine patch superfamily enzyme